MEDASASLQLADSNGQTLFHHLARLLVKLSKDDTKTSAENLVRTLSLKLKNESFKYQIPKEIVKGDDDAKVKEILDKLAKIAGLCKIPAHMSLPPVKEYKKPEPEEDGDEPEPAKLHYPRRKGDRPAPMPDLQGDSQMLLASGVNLGEEVTAMLSLSIRELAVVKELEQVRFFGKITGIKNDYYIVECAVPESLVDMDKKRVAAQLETYKTNKTPVSKMDYSEPWGSGINAFAYYVTNNPAARASEWTLLPRVQPLWIRTSKSVRRLFTGDLRARVGGFPNFPWGEKAYLRARIAEIAHSCTIAPSEAFIQDDELEEEDGPAIMINDEHMSVVPGSEGWEKTKLWTAEETPADIAGKWTHIMPAIREGKKIGGINRNGGRITAWVAPKPDENDEDAEDIDDYDDEEEEKEFLRSVADDESKLPELKQEDEESLPPWKFKLCDTFGKFPSENPNAMYAALSLQWPGAACVSDGQLYCNIYVGNGQVRLASYFSPPLPPAICEEFQLLDEDGRPQLDDEGAVVTLVEQKDERVPVPDPEGDEDD